MVKAGAAFGCVSRFGSGGGGLSIGIIPGGRMGATPAGPVGGTAYVGANVFCPCGARTGYLLCVGYSLVVFFSVSSYGDNS